jgi:hypothetical protein
MESAPHIGTKRSTHRGWINAVPIVLAFALSPVATAHVERALLQYKPSTYTVECGAQGCTFLTTTLLDIFINGPTEFTSTVGGDTYPSGDNGDNIPLPTLSRFHNFTSVTVAGNTNAYIDVSLPDSVTITSQCFCSETGSPFGNSGVQHLSAKLAVIVLFSSAENNLGCSTTAGALVAHQITAMSSSTMRIYTLTQSIYSVTIMNDTDGKSQTITANTNAPADTIASSVTVFNSQLDASFLSYWYTSTGAFAQRSSDFGITGFGWWVTTSTGQVQIPTLTAWASVVDVAEVVTCTTTPLTSTIDARVYVTPALTVTSVVVGWPQFTIPNYAYPLALSLQGSEYYPAEFSTVTSVVCNTGVGGAQTVDITVATGSYGYALLKDTSAATPFFAVQLQGYLTHWTPTVPMTGVFANAGSSRVSCVFSSGRRMLKGVVPVDLAGVSITTLSSSVIPTPQIDQVPVAWRASPGYSGWQIFGITVGVVAAAILAVWGISILWRKYGGCRNFGARAAKGAYAASGLRSLA